MLWKTKLKWCWIINVLLSESSRTDYLYILRSKGFQKWYEKIDQKEEDKGEDEESVLKDEGDEQG